jgi:uncharacterized protein (DUF58 family)
VTLVFKCYYWLYRLFSWARDRIRRRFTRAGLGVLGGFLVASLTGLDTDNTVAYQAFTLLLFLLLLAMPFGFFFKARLSATRLLPRLATAGCPLRYRVVVRNLTAKTQAGLTCLENLSDPRPAFSEWMAVQRADQKRFHSFQFSQRARANPFRVATVKEAPVDSVPPHQEVETAVELIPWRRGVLQFLGVTLTRSDPLGLFRAFVKLALPQTVLILPKRYLLPPVALPGTTKYQPGGVAFASQVGQSQEFVALRDYRRGDPWRHIHWRSWAKADKPIVKEFEDEFFVRHALVLDTFIDDPRSELFEEAVSVAASFACSVLTQESLLDLLFVGPDAYCFTAGRGLAHRDQLLEVLAAVQACGNRPFRALETLVLDHVAIVSGCICVLLAWDEERRRLVHKLKMLGVPLLVLVMAEPGRSAPPDSDLPRDEGGRFHVLEMGRIEQDLARIA